MAIKLINPRIWFAQYHLSSDHNKVDLEVGYDEQNATVFTDAATRTNGTIPKVSVTGGGFITLGTGNVHAALKGNVNVANVPVSLGINGGVDGTAVEFFLARVLKYVSLGDVGTIAPFTWSAQGQGHPSVPGTILAVGSKTTTENGIGATLGQLGATQRLYAALHVISVSGTNPTLDVLIASDDHPAFPTATTRITFAQKTAAGSEWATPVAGPIATDYIWRARWTIGGTSSPTFDVVVVAGIF